jgi:hypothetical protein
MCLGQTIDALMDDDDDDDDALSRICMAIVIWMYFSVLIQYTSDPNVIWMWICFDNGSY